MKALTVSSSGASNSATMSYAPIVQNSSMIFMPIFSASAMAASPRLDLREPGADPQRFRFQLFRMALSSSNFRVSVLKLVRYPEPIGNTNRNALRRSVNLLHNLDCVPSHSERGHRDSC